MIPNLINTVIGIWLVYAAVLNPAALGGRMAILGSGIVVLLIAIWAYRVDYLKWPATTAGVLGVGLAVDAGVRLLEPSGFVTFWVVLFAGIAVAVVSLWSALYRKPSASEYASRHDRRRPAARTATVPTGGRI